MVTTRRNRNLLLTSTCAALVLAMGGVPEAQHQHHGHGPDAPAAGMKTPTVTSAPDGTLWRVWVDGDHVLVGSSADGGRRWSTGVRVTRVPESIDANSESRPKIVLGPEGEIYVSYTQTGPRRFTGDIRFSRSLDRGRTFSPPVTVNDDGLETGHRFDELAVGPDGTVYLVWIDKRDLERATAAKRPYAGAAMYYTVSRDRGQTFAPNRKIKDHTCECCRIAHAFDEAGRLVLFWRDVMKGSIRDHALVRLTPDGMAGPVQRVTADGWALDACPHHGPSLVMGAGGSMHIMWFTGEGSLGPGAFYGRLTADARLTGTPVRLGAALPTTGHADVWARGGRVLVAWRERRAPAGAAVMLIESADGGRTFGPPRELAVTAGASDYPFLLETPGGVLLSWFSAAEGHRVLAVAGPIRTAVAR
jgi:hypothetical protein